MSSKKESRVLLRVNFKLSSALDNFLNIRDITARSVKTLDEVTEALAKKPYNLVVVEVSDLGDTLTKLLAKIKSISHTTEIIVVTDTEVRISGDGVIAKDIPLHDIVFAFIEKPLNESYLATLILTALEKTRLKAEPGASEQAVVLSASVNSLNSAVTITDINQNILYINTSHERMFGYSAVQIMGEKSTVLYPADDPSGVSGKIYEAILMVGWEGERLGLKKDGSAFPIYEKTSIIKDTDGKHIGIVSVIDDISSKKTLELALKESEERYRTFIETAKSAIIAVDEEANIILYNPAAQELFEYETDEVRDKEFFMLFPERHEDVLKSKHTLGNGNRESFARESVFEIEGLSKSGREFPIEVSLSRCRLDGRSVVTAIIFDITKRKHMQEQLYQSAKLAAVGELISGVTHEINNPLAVVIGYSEMILNEQNLDGESRKAVESINREAQRAKKVIQNLLSFARKHNPEKELIQINDVLEATLGLVNYELSNNSINITEDLDPGLPQIVADPHQLQQVFMNLIMNAQHAMEEAADKKELIIISKIKEGRKDFVQMIFEDNGPGIPGDKLPKIFDPFYTSKPKGKGTGLGLSVSFGIIKEHGGDIYAENTRKNGARFIIDLPIAE
jgi:PAS domain S-box-containing protein